MKRKLARDSLIVTVFALSGSGPHSARTNSILAVQ
jgi:hypothetical protein